MKENYEFEPIQFEVVTIAGEVSIDKVEVDSLKMFSCDPPCQ